MSGINILEHIPVGHENAVDSVDIARWTGLTPREVRKLISTARREAVIINLQDGCGYFLPREDEKSLINEWVRQEESRLKVHAMSLRGAREALKE